MDVHRCRFVEWPPSGINALAFTYTSGSARRGQPLRLAIGRANGDIEIWDPRNGNWFHETTFYGGQDRSVEGLAWTTDPDDVDSDGNSIPGKLRLFSIGYSDAVTEWDLAAGVPLRHSSGSHSDVWCLAARPRPKQSKQSKKSKGNLEKAQDIAVGCADGGLVLLSTEDNDLQFEKYIARPSANKARALSIAWQTADIIVAGYSDSTIRIYNATTGAELRELTLDLGSVRGPKEKLCWAIEVLTDGTLVSGDSSGEICWWDANNFGQTQKLKAHDSDVLCLTSTADGKSVISGSMDRRVAMFRLNDNHRWAKVEHKRVHHHDIKALARYEDKATSVAVSGGIDAHPVALPLRGWGNENHRAIPYTPQSSPMIGSRRLVVSWWTNEVSVWRVRPRDESYDGDSSDSQQQEQPEYNLMARLSLKCEEHVSRAAITHDGSFLAVSTAAQIKLFRLRRSGEKLKVRKVSTPSSMETHGAKLLEFSRDSRWLLTVDVRGAIRVYRVQHGPDATTVLGRPLKLTRPKRESPLKSSLDGPWGSYSRTVTRVAISSDSRIIAVGDLAGHVDSWLLEGESELASELAKSTNGTLSPPTTDDDDDRLDSQSASDSDSDSSSAAQKRPQKLHTLLGQTWVLNPSSRTTPKLSAPPLILSFMPPSEIFPSDTLLTLTATHALTLLSVRTGALHPWTRRNPSALLPAQLRLQVDRASGIAWDVAASGSHVRAWLFGASWLAMLDLARDLPTDNTIGFSTASQLKRKRSNSHSDSRALAKRAVPDAHSLRMARHERERELQASLAARRGTSGAGSHRAKYEGAVLASRAARELLPPGRGAREEGEGSSDDDEDGEDVQVADSQRRIRRGDDSDGEDEDEDADHARKGLFDGEPDAAAAAHDIALALHRRQASSVRQRTEKRAAPQKDKKTGNAGVSTSEAVNDDETAEPQLRDTAEGEQHEAEQGGEEDSDDSDSDYDPTIPRALRRGAALSLAQQNNAAPTSSVARKPAVDNALSTSAAAAGSSGFYLTQRYRPILGVIALSASDDVSDDEEEEGEGEKGSAIVRRLPRRRAFEVALVERPVWEIDLPVRRGDGVERFVEREW